MYLSISFFISRGGVAKLTEENHEAGVSLVPRVLVRIALDAAISPEVAFADLGIVVAREGLEHLQGVDKNAVAEAFYDRGSP